MGTEGKVELVPGNARMLGADTGVGTEVLGEWNLERHEWWGRVIGWLLGQVLFGGRLGLVL